MRARSGLETRLKSRMARDPSPFQILAVFCLLALLAGCAVGPDYQSLQKYVLDLDGSVLCGFELEK